MKIKSQKDFFAGLMFMAMGIAFAWGATNYNVGVAARMGPGYFPLLLGVILVAIGAFIVFEAMVIETADGEPIGKWAWKPLGYVIAANLLFGLLLAGLPKVGIPQFGLIIAIYGLVFVGARAGDHHESHLREQSGGRRRKKSDRDWKASQRSPRNARGQARGSRVWVRVHQSG